MADQSQSIVDHEKNVNPVEENRSPTDHELFGELTERALGLSVTEEILFSSLAEYLAAKGIGFAAVAIMDGENSLEVEALFAPNGTNHTSYARASISESEPIHQVTFIANLTENPEDGKVLFKPSIDEVVIDKGGIFQQAFGNEPVMVIGLPGSRSVKEILLLCGSGLDDKWELMAKNLAEKLSSALEVSRLRSDLNREDDHREWLFAYSKEGHLLIDAQGKIQDINQKAAELLGKPREKLLGRNIVDVIPGLKDFLDSSKLSTEASPSAIEVDYQVQGKLFRYLHVEHHLVNTDEHSNALLKISDLTEHWRHEDMIRQLGKLTTDADHEPSVGIFMQDSHGKFIRVNETASRMLGYSLDELEGAHWTKIVPKDQRYKVSQANLQRMRGETGRYEIQLLHRSGRRLDMLVSESPYHEGGRYTGTFIFITDLSKLRRAEAIVLRQNWELQHVIDRFVVQNHNAIDSLHMVDVQALLQQVGDELHQLGIACVVATFAPNEPFWNVQYATPHLGVKKSKEGHQRGDVETSITVDLFDPSLALLQKGEAIFVEEPDRSVESLASESSPFNPFLEGVKMCPRILAPLKASERLFGVLVVCSENLTSGDIPTITTFADHLSIALEKSRLLTRTLIQSRLGQFLADIVSLSSQEKDIACLLKNAGQLMLEAVKMPVCTFSFLEEDQNSLSVLLSATALPPEEASAIPAPGSIIKLEDFTIVEGVLRTGRKAMLPGSTLLFMGEREYGDQDTHFPTLLLPMMAMDKCIGLVSIPLKGLEDLLSQDEQLFLQTSADQISLAVERIRQETLDELKAKQDQELSSLTNGILASRDLEEVIQKVLEGMINLYPCHFVCLTSFDDQAKTAEVLGVRGEDENALEVGQIIPYDEWDGIGDLLDGKMVQFEASDDHQSSPTVAKWVFTQGLKSWLFIPLFDQNEVMGALSIASQQSNIASATNLDMAARIQEHLSTALRNARNHTKTKHQAEEMAAIVDLALEISEEQDFRALLQKIASGTTKIIDATMGAIFLVDKSAEEITLAAEFGLPTPPSVLKLLIGQGLAGKVWEKRGAIILNHARDLSDPNWLEACYATGSAIGVPLLWEDEVRGVMAFFTPGEENRFGLNDIDILSKVAAQVVVRIENVEEIEKTVRRVNQLLVVNDIARRISTILVEDLLFTEVVRRVAHGLNLELVILFLVEEDKITEAASYYLPQDMYGIWEPITLKMGTGGVVGWVANEGQPILIPDVSSDPNYLPMIPVDFKVQSVVGIPLKLKGEVTGVLLTGSEKIAAFDKADIDALLALGAHISTCIENARLYEETKLVQHRLAESEKLRALGLVTGGIAHDFNNVLSVILSRAELALNHTDDEQARRHLEQVVTTAKEGGETIHRLEGFASFEKDKTDFIGVDINQIVQEAIEICKPRWKGQAQGDGVDLQVVTELHADQPILGVASELREVLANLIFNALEAIPAGGNIIIRTENKDNGISLIVSDDGVGMTPEMKQQAFVPFFTTKPGRVGLGLSMCYGILQRHGGTIDIQSGIGEGTTVTLWLPIYAKSGVEENLSEAITTPALVEPSVILVVEDEKSILEGLVETFVDAGHKVLAASNGLEGFERFLEAGKLDIVFTDLGMPKLSGWELIEQLRAFDPKLPIVIFSGWGDVVNPIKLRQYGIAKVIRKPFEMAKLHSTLYEVLAMRKKLDPS
jgi:PAS domain S-box-containing protein